MLGDGTALGALMIVAGGFGLRHALRIKARAAQIGALAVTGPAQAMPGIVRVRGRLRIQDPVTSPFSQTACCWYQVQVEKSADDGTSMGSGWRSIHQESSQSEFYIEDETGSLKVRPQGLATDLPCSFEQEVISAPTNAVQRRLVDYVAGNVPKKVNSLIFKMTGSALASHVNVAAPVLRGRLQALRQRHQRALYEETRGQSYRFRETHLSAGEECEIAGTLNSDGADRVLQLGAAGSPFFIGSNLGAGWDTEQRRHARLFGGWSLTSMVTGLLILVFA